jgi:MFS-type transporter involved in bile tolerance (Atg22 family)
VAAAFMVAACFAVVINIPCKICFHKSVDISATTSHDRNLLPFKHISCTFSHVAGKHNLHAFLAQYKRYA